MEGDCVIVRGLPKKGGRVWCLLLISGFQSLTLSHLALVCPALTAYWAESTWLESMCAEIMAARIHVTSSEPHPD